jgi:hypothetical protein
MDTQESYDAWARQMIDRHCHDLFTSVGTAEHKGVTYMRAVVEDPRGEKYRISLSTYGRELTLKCQAFHSHLDQFDEDNHEQEFLDAIAWIRDFRADKIVIFTKLEGERVVSAMAADPAYRVEPRNGERVEVISFSGALNRTIEGVQSSRPTDP